MTGRIIGHHSTIFDFVNNKIFGGIIMEVTFIGNISKDAVLRQVGPEGNKYSVLDIWVGENLGRSNTPDTENKTAWRKVTLWRGYADKMAQYLKKGRRIEVRGFAGEAKSYTRGNEIVSYLPVNASRIYFMDSKREEDLPPEEVLNQEPSAEAVAISPEDMPF